MRRRLLRDLGGVAGFGLYGRCPQRASLPGFLNDHGQAASQPAVDPEAEGFELEDDARQVITHVPTPHEIYDELSAYVMGQEDAKRAMSVAVYNHYPPRDRGRCCAFGL